MVRRKLSILYALVERNEEASIKSDAGMSTVDKEALHGVRACLDPGPACWSIFHS